MALIVYLFEQYGTKVSKIEENEIPIIRMILGGNISHRNPVISFINPYPIEKLDEIMPMSAFERLLSCFRRIANNEKDLLNIDDKVDIKHNENTCML